ncbi:hypothetical protein PRMUPPPA20_18790 [Xylanibacter ruminicola]|jgi:hypothetical protein|uniref:Lipoprotein n=2 Tax=Xylanibacter ruminicola TaxID=839 RepID=D5ESP7_XYLR2|nr:MULTISPECIES: lipocalin-like domain-containing protein [Prevotellaceae]MBP3247949.1 lipocalin-like domain-containing protein [Prevotella sp.]ADE82910.1 putative lipoprotein [Xylanibacter ruminicola 23]MDO4985887.1 lipocalin-like domain-containing protein [Prevotella sp.]QVJ80775.1 lipocalin-like domain-containing protein [Xylanibacter ruminicola]SDQ14118.1 Lipocalin-like domain-containing protein [Prevotella sp. khp1]
MKRLLYIIIGVTLLLTSCDKEDSANGHLDGFWQMSSSPGITWAFQGHILELRDVKKVHQDIVMSFTREGDKLKLSDPYRVDRDSDDVALKDADMLIPYGISNTSTEFRISELTSSRMVLDNNTTHLEFRKF